MPSTPLHAAPIALSLLLLSCLEPLDPRALEATCRPSDPACADEDYDGDGVVNRDDPFPADPACAQRDDQSCAACGVPCGEGERCDLAAAACVARDLEVCDAVDNDGDGRVDEGVETSAPRSESLVGACAGARLLCSGGGWAEPPLASLAGYEPAETACDGV
ncbi:MAG: hypothetical protein FJ138_14790, partial [Deltaproteobacteria bacterium]|nr:hypothetical protein [Deltaproteobacteria bacterium]